MYYNCSFTNQDILLPDYEKFKTDITSMLKAGLDKQLHYHGFHHVEYVMKAALLIASDTDLTEKETLLLKTAVLLHDSGFLHTYRDHEIVGTKIAAEMLPEYGYSEEDIKTISGMIMATRIPQHATNPLEEIIADADLEYLGTDQFDRISEYLFAELIAYGFIKSREEWNNIQINFIKNHTYYTRFCRENREKKKQENLAKVMKEVK